ncbi:MAG: hypothetical protein ACKVU2_15695 [Saprospiraceae bacterium]
MSGRFPVGGLEGFGLEGFGFTRHSLGVGKLLVTGKIKCAGWGNVLASLRKSTFLVLKIV